MKNYFSATYKLSALLLLFFLSVMMRGQTMTVEAPASVGQTDAYFKVIYKVSGRDVKDFKSPDFSNHFIVLSGPNVSVFSSQIFVNGKSSSVNRTEYTFLVAPKDVGSFTITPAKANVNGKTVSSRPLTITVVKGEAAPKNKKDGTFSLTAEISNPSPYKNEGLLLSYVFKFPMNCEISNVQIDKLGDFSNIISLPVPDKYGPANFVKEDGVYYRIQSLQQYYIYPQRTGKVEIPSFRISFTIKKADDMLDPIDVFFNGAYHGEKKTLASKPVYINVRDLPQPAPANFSGAVGEFSVNRQIIGKSVSTNEIATCRLEIQGTGNLNSLSAPDMTFPKGFDTYLPKKTVTGDFAGLGGYYKTCKQMGALMAYKGKAIVDYSFTAPDAGETELPPFQFCYFDVKKNRYVTLSLPSLKLNVKQGKCTKEELQELRQLRKQDISPIFEGKYRSFDENNPFFWGSLSFYLTYFALLLLFVIVYWRLRKYLEQKRDVVGQRRKNAAKKVSGHLASASKLIDAQDGSVFYAEAQKCMENYVCDKYNVKQADLTLEKIKRLLADNHSDEKDIADFEALYQEAQYERFAPKKDTDQSVRRKFFESLNQLFNRLSAKQNKDL